MRSCAVNAATGICRPSPLLSLCATLAAGLPLLAPGAARAATTAPDYNSKVIAMSGAPAGDALIPAGYHLFAGGLNDAGQVVFSAGMIDGSRPELLIQYARGKFATIVRP